MLKAKLKKLYSKIDSHSLEVIRKSVASSIVKLVGMISGLGVSVILGRLLGVSDFGTIELANRIVNVLLVISVFGIPNTLLKEISIGHNNKDWKYIGDCIYSGNIFNGSIAIIVSVIVFVTSPYLSSSLFNNTELSRPLQILSLGLVFQVISRNYAAGINGFGKVWQSNLVNQTLSMFFLLIVLSLFYFSDSLLNLVTVAILFFSSRIIVTISLGLYWKKLFSFKMKRSFQKHLIKPSLYLLLVNAAAVINSSISIFLLGSFMGSDKVGLYSVALRLALLTSFLLQIVNTAISPKIAALYADKRIDELQLMVKRITSLLIAFGALSLLFFILFGRYIISLWGTGFNEAYPLLVVIAIGQFVNVSSGSVGYFLIMTGNEKILSKISYSFLGLNIVLNISFIYLFGVIGAATATSIVIIGENLTRAYFVFARTRIRII